MDLLMLPVSLPDGYNRKRYSAAIHGIFARDGIDAWDKSPKFQ